MVLKADFFDYYHYKTELTALCREYHLAASGTKAELNQRLRAAILRHLSLRSPSQWQLSNGKPSRGLS